MSQLRVFSVVLILGAVLASLATADTVSAARAQPPHVRLVMTDLLAQEVGSDPGIVTIQRTGKLNRPLVVMITVTGTATLGGEAPDFHISLTPGRTPGTFFLTIPAGSAQATIQVTPYNDPFVDPDEYVELRVVRCEKVKCVIDAPYIAQIKIISDEVLDDGDGDGFTVAAGDCDDADPNEFPGQVWYADCDNDGFYSATAVIACDLAGVATPCADASVPDGGFSHYAGTDCDDEDSMKFPGGVCP